MKTALLFAVALNLAGVSMLAQDAKPAGAAAKSNDAPAQATAPKSKTDQAELEAKFKETLTGATLAGRWCSIKNGTLGAESEDKYSIVSVTKLAGTAWLINARIQYGNHDVVAPIPVQVKWAGDTPVIVVDKIPVPGSGTYSARVLIFEHTYAGTWTGGDHGGLLNGVITNTTRKDNETGK